MAETARTLDPTDRLSAAPTVTTLLDLVAAVAQAARSDAEVVATVTHLLRSGKIKLIGNFQGADVRVR